MPAIAIETNVTKTWTNTVVVMLFQSKQADQFLLYEKTIAARDDSRISQAGSVRERCTMGQKYWTFCADFQRSGFRGCESETVEPESVPGNA